MRKIIDIVVRFGLPVASLAALLAGTYVTSDFSAWAKAQPGVSAVYLFIGAWIFTAFIVSAIIATFLAIVQSAFLTPSVAKLESRNQELQNQVDLVATNLRAVFDAQMLQISNRLSVNQGEDVRVSVYAHDGIGHFLLFGRYSPNPEHRKIGRPAYPDGEGCVGKGWLHSWWFEEDVGDTARKYNKKSRDVYGLDNDTLSQLKMRSRFFAAYRVDLEADPIAVIVVESLSHNRFRENEVQDALIEAARSIGPLVRAFRSYVPDPRRASDKGF